MKTFKRHRTVDDLRTLASEQGAGLRDENYQKGSDLACLAGMHPMERQLVVDAIIEFNSDQERNEPWFVDLLNFFYTDEDYPT